MIDCSDSWVPLQEELEELQLQYELTHEPQPRVECLYLEEVLVHSELVGGGELHAGEAVVQEQDQHYGRRKHWARHSSSSVLE